MSYQQVILFVDKQNFYNGARRAFFSRTDPHYCGQFDPIKLGTLLCSRSAPGITRILKQVRVYTGRPDATREPRTYSAHMRQCFAWHRSGVEVVTRGLRYPAGWPSLKAQEKGIDVALAVDSVTMGIDHAHDLGVIASTDSDLKPALEYVRRKCAPTCQVQAAAWISARSKSTLAAPGSGIWCHRLAKADYDAVADPTDYNIRLTLGTSGP